MVRVISVHHFSNQDIHTCEEPLAATTAPPDRLLLAFAQHVIEVRDLAKGGDPMFTFPTVDEVHSMIYCCNGDYVATLEHKQNRQGGQCSYSRVYSNWADSNAVQQPMRARIAGHVTPSSAQTGAGGLEMIELPLKRTPNAIACCQVTGNIIIASNRTLYFYYFKVKTHDISRQKFIDFEESPISLDLCFSPLKLEICEDVIACMSKEYLHIFKIGQLEKEKTEQNLRSKKGNINSHNETKKERSSINWDEILREEYDGNTSLKEKDNSENWLEKLDKNSFPVTVHLPGIESQETVPRPEGPSYRNTPFKVAPLEMTINVHCSSPSASFMEDTSITNLLQLQLLSSLNGSCSQGICVGREEFRCLTLKPMYLKKGKCSSSSKYEVKNSNPMRSCYWKNLGSVVCVVSTQQEGFVYHFPMSGSVETVKLQQAACVTIYPFTAPVLCIVMENYLLHALTEVGLETYTLRSGHQLLQGIQDVDNINFTCPTSDDPVCLVGLRPFLGVEHMLLSDLHLSLLACSEGSSMSSQDSHSMNWTLYSLQIPQPSTLYSDILTIASVHRWSSPTTYCHLLCEAHVILQIALNTVSWISKLNHAVGLAEPMINKEDTEKLELLFKDSCALLGDYYINCDCEEDWELATPYYNMSGLSPADVIVRVQNLEIPKEADNDTRKQNQLKGLMKYLKTSLFLVGQGTQSFNPSIPNVTNTLLDLFETYNPCEVSLLVLHSNLLREYATDRVLNVMKKQLCSRAAPNPSDALALVLLYVQKGSPEQANAVLNSFDSNQLSNILTEKRNILFEVSSTAKSNNRSGDGRYNRTSDSPLTFSELSVILMDSNPNVLASVLSNLVARHIMSLQEVLQVFLEYLPSRIGITGSSASLVLQVFLENYFANYFSVHHENGFSSVNSLPVIEALKILVRSYLSDLQYYNISNKKSGNEKHPPEIGRHITKKNPLFAEKRFSFLQKMPPFAPNLSKRLLAHQNGETIDDSKSDDSDEINEQKNKSLIKLQCLLCSGKLPKECVLEVYQFLQTHPQLHGNLSLQILCVPTKEATSVLLNFCPQSLLQFAKDKYIGDNEYRHLLALLHKKIQAISNDLLKPYYLQVMNDILTHAAQTFPLDTLRQILPPDSEADYSNFIHMGQQVTHANHIRTLIMVTGHQLLVTLKL